MTEKEKFYANEKREMIFDAVGYKCQFPGCEKRCTELAHVIKNNKTAAKEVMHYWFEMFDEEISEKQAFEIINQPVNTIPVCGNKRHNDFYAVNSPGAIISQLQRIKRFMDGNKNEKN